MSGHRWQQTADELADARTRGEIDDEQWFNGMAAIFATAYLAADDPRAQSGFGGDDARWEAARRPIVEAVDRDGTFLDIGCASGYLIECVVRWSPHRLEPYGLELTPALAALPRAGGCRSGRIASSSATLSRGSPRSASTLSVPSSSTSRRSASRRSWSACSVRWLRREAA